MTTRDRLVDEILRRMRASWGSELDGIAGERDSFERLSANFPEPHGVSEQWLELNGVPAIETRLDTDSSGESVILYLHGGAFVIGSANIYREQSSRLARATRSDIATVDYRLAPEHPYPAAVEDAVAAYRGLLERGWNASSIVIAGDSAGGNLSLAAAMKLRDAGDPLPAALVLLSPWVDLTCSSASMRTNADPRHLAQQQGLLYSANTYLDEADAKAPLASPLFGDLSNLPPMLIQVGALETLLDEGVELDRRASAAGAQTTLHIYEGMIHEWHLLAALLDDSGQLPEAEQAFEEIGSFVQQAVSR